MCTFNKKCAFFCLNSSDGTLFAVGVGDDETPAQVLILDPQTGGQIVQTALPGLGKELRAWLDLFVIWGVTF